MEGWPTIHPELQFLGSHKPFPTAGVFLGQISITTPPHEGSAMRTIGSVLYTQHELISSSQPASSAPPCTAAVRSWVTPRENACRPPRNPTPAQYRKNPQTGRLKLRLREVEGSRPGTPDSWQFRQPLSPGWEN